MFRPPVLFLLVCSAACGLAVAPHASAQLTRTWVSGVGNDVNAGTRAAPCKTFAGAISKTAAGGEIDVLDPSGFGAVTITKSITIDGGTELASVLVAGTNGITIAAGASDVVILRHLDINGFGAAGLSLSGINILQAGQVRIESCRIFGFDGSSAGNAISVTSSANVNVSLKDVVMASCNQGVSVAPSGSGVTAKVAADHVQIHYCTTGVLLASGADVSVGHSDLSLNATGVQANAGSVLVVEHSLVSGCTTDAVDANDGSIVISDNDINDNSVGLATSTAGRIYSYKNNRLVGNQTTANPFANLTLQ